jgi:hypothetical protein
MFQTAYSRQPAFVVVVTINPTQSLALGMALALLLTLLVFFPWPDVRIKIEYGGTKPVQYHPLHYGR